MDRRLFLVSAVAGFTDPVTPMVQQVQQAATPPPGPVTQSGDAGFDAWSQDFVTRAVAAGWPEGLLRAELAGLTPDPGVLQSDRGQPEFSRPVGDYMRAAVSPTRIATARQKAAEMGDWPARIEARYGVDRNILLAIWGVESGFGVVQGDLDVIRSLATLAADGRRRGWAEGELFAALRILATHAAAREQLKGSWAGAMGQTQLEPTVFIAKAQDMDGDGKADIWSSAPDALASAAQILKDAGWKTGQSWAREVAVPSSFDWSLLEGPRLTPADWSQKGLVRADGEAFAEADQAAPCGLIAPAGAGGPAFLAFPNHFVIRAYNNSTSYALAVGLIADGVAGAPPLARAWPVEASLSLQMRKDAQSGLARLGFDPGPVDGVFGERSRKALRGWQAKAGLIPDGHLTAELAARLATEQP